MNYCCFLFVTQWREFAKEMDGVIRIGAVNCGDNNHLCRRKGINSYPSLYVYRAGQVGAPQQPTAAVYSKAGHRCSMAAILQALDDEEQNVMSGDGKKPSLLSTCSAAAG